MTVLKPRRWSGFFGQQPRVTARKNPTDGDDIKSQRRKSLHTLPWLQSLFRNNDGRERKDVAVDSKVNSARTTVT
jgi:hypothetical protein